MYEILVDLPIQIPKDEIYRYMGYPSDKCVVPEMIINMVEEEIATALPLLTPSATFITCEYDATKSIIYNKEGNLLLSGKDIILHLANCNKVTLFSCTIGSKIEPYIDTYFKAGEFTRGLILDAIGSTSVEFTTDTINHYLASAAYRQQYNLVSRFSPGYGDWDLSIQRDLIAASGGSAIGIHVTGSSMLLPRKSISGIIGWIPGRELNIHKSCSPCDICKLPRCKNPICKGGIFHEKNLT